MAAENGALPKGKVGGVGDVIRDLPLALAEQGWQPTVVTPAYGMFGDLPGAEAIATIGVWFGGARLDVTVLAIPVADSPVTHIALEHPVFSPQGNGKIYCDDDATRPFATDATKFALFSAAAATYIDSFGEKPDVVHLHDWHSAYYCALRAFDPQFAGLKPVRTVYTIHNLAMQGIRPLDGHESSLKAWFPYLVYNADEIVDPRFPDCVNPMRAAIRLADRVNTVSPTYAQEIQRPNDPAHGFEGGEGLEADLQALAGEGRLEGILNGCNYERRDRRRPGWRRLLNTVDEELRGWGSKEDGRSEIHQLAAARLRSLPKRRPANLLTSIGRVTPQKMGLFLTQAGSGQTALEDILDELGSKGVMIMLGNGDAALERRIATLAASKTNLLFLCGYAESFSELLYKAGDLFLMPSTFEPCGISQMLAMRAGQPCVVHEVGGLKDTVRHDVNGFSFAGNSPAEQAENLVHVVSQALRTRSADPDRWLRIRDRATAARFTWAAAAKHYIGKLYD